MFFLVTSFFLLSETAHGFLQDVFAQGTLIFMDSTVAVCVIFTLLSLLCSLMWLCPTPRYHSMSRGTSLLNLLMFALLVASIPSFLHRKETSPSPLTLLQVGGVCAFVYLVGFYSVRTFTSILEPEAPEQQYEADADVIIVGCGTAGASLAYSLGNQGKKVIVIEKELKMLPKFIGELMQPGGMRALRSMGLEECALPGGPSDLSENIPMQGYALYSGRRQEYTMLPYPKGIPNGFLESFGIKDVAEDKAQRPIGHGMHNSPFVERLRRKMRSQENVTLIHGTVSKMNVEKNMVTGVSYRRKDKNGDTFNSPLEEVSAPLVIAADGNWSSLRRNLSEDAPEVVSSFVAVLLKHKEGEQVVPRPYHGHVVLAQPSPILIYQISPTETRVLVDVPGKVPKKANGDLAKHLIEVAAPQLPPITQKAFIEAVKNDAVNSMPNRSFHTTPTTMDRIFMIGDTFNMRHPLTGGGMTVALKDVELMSRLLKDANLWDVQELNEIRERFSVQRRGYASTVNILANALYYVFSAPDGMPVREELRDSCYGYLHAGGACTQGPINLLSAISPDPLVLIVHFYLVAAYATYRCLMPFPTPSRLAKCYRVFQAACVIIMPLIEREQVTFLSWSPIAFLVNVIFPYRGYSPDDFQM